jgi:oligosaccharide repeat unit polymerase
MLGLVANAAYWYGIANSGGFLAVYSQTKGHYSAGSGWINEMVNLGIPGSALLLFAWEGRRRYQRYLPLALFAVLPLLTHGFFGGRRGPTFIVLTTLLFGWYVASGKRARVWKVTLQLGLVGVFVLFLFSQRRYNAVGSELDLSLGRFIEKVLPAQSPDVYHSDDTIFLYGYLNGIETTGSYHWGQRYAATYVVRPIPRQIWPTKYEDLGLEWMANPRQGDFAGISETEWMDILGWVPVPGSAAGFIGDLFLEFSWGGLLGCFLFGWLFAWIWSQGARWGGVWTLLYMQLAALSVYVPTQSVSAVLHRFLLMAVPTVVLWRLYIRPSEALPSEPEQYADEVLA